MSHLMIAAALATAALVAAAPATAAESLTFPSLTITDPVMRNLTDPSQASQLKDVSINALLSLPPGASGPVPIVVVAHTSGGVRDGDRDMVKAMNKAGFAAISYESYVPRGVTDVQRGGGQAAIVNQALDAMSALKALSADPRIDVKRSALVGLSAGGGAAILLASQVVRKRIAGDSGLGFAALVAFYPGVHAAPAKTNYEPTPLLILVGDQDDYQAPKRVKLWVDYIKRERPDADVTFELVAGARHSFFDSGLKGFMQDNSVANPSGCPVPLVPTGGFGPVLQPDGRISEPTTADQSREANRCAPTRGASLGYSPRAAESALNRTVAFLRDAFARERRSYCC